MRRATITLTDDLEAAVAAFQRDQPAPPTLTVIAQAALQEYLAQRGYLPIHRRLHIRPAPHGSGESTVSRDHDRFFTDEWK